MPMPPFLRSTMTQTAHVATRTGASSSGDPTYGAPTAILARVEPTRKRIVNADGEEVVSSWAMTVVPEAVIGESVRIWLPGESPTTTLARVPLSVIRGIDEVGATSHWEVYV